METRFLETFLMVVDHGSLAEASRRLGVTPAAPDGRSDEAATGRRADASVVHGQALTLSRARVLLSCHRHQHGIDRHQPYSDE